MTNLKEVFENAEKLAEEQVGSLIDDRKFLTALFLEEAEKQRDDVKEKINECFGSNNQTSDNTDSDDLELTSGGEEDEESIVNAFKEDLTQFITNWYEQYSVKNDRHHSVFMLSEELRRNVMARLMIERKDRLRNILNKQMFNFSDLVMLDDRAIQKVLREVDQQELAKALKAADIHVKNKIFNNMSKRAAGMLQEDMEFMGPVRKQDVFEAQDKIIDIVRKLEDNGDIVIVISSNDEIIY